MFVMRKQAWQPGPLVEASPQKLLEGDSDEADEGGSESVTMKNCNAGKHAKKQKIGQHR